MLISYGFVGTLSSLVLIGVPIYIYQKFKNKSFFDDVYFSKKLFKWLLFAVLLALVSSIIEHQFLYLNKNQSGIAGILRIVLLTPIFEEILFRKFLFGYSLSAIKNKIRLKECLLFLWISVSLLIPQIIFLWFGWINGPLNYYTPILIISIPLLAWSSNLCIKNNLK